MAVVKDLTGQRFGRLTAIAEVGRTNNGNAKWLCKCDCGGEKVVASFGLRSGRTQSCGCIKREQNETMFTTHGESGHRKTKLYRIWSGMKSRCLNSNWDCYQKYGAKGTDICTEWVDSYESFRDWAMKNGYRDGLTIDRKDNSKGYSPDNCRWATTKEQNNNRTNNHRLTFNGKTQTMAEWSEELGMSYKAIEHRINRGWPVSAALTVPVGGGGRYASFAT